MSNSRAPLLEVAYLDPVNPSKDDVAAVFNLIAEVTWPVNKLAPVNPVKAVARIMQVATHGIALIFEDNGKPVGTVGLIRNDLWFADAEIMVEVWCSILPNYLTPQHMRFMVGTLKALSRDTGLKVLLMVQTGQRGRVLTIDGTKE